MSEQRERPAGAHRGPARSSGRPERDRRGGERDRRGAKDQERVRQMRARGGSELSTLDHLEPAGMSASRAARERWERVHGESGEQALEGLRETCEEILIQGHHTQDEGGYHALYTEGYRMVIEPEGEVIISYDTLHRERTLAEVRAGVPSRFRGKALTRAALLAQDDEFIDEIHIPRRVLETHGPEADWDEFADEIRDAVAEALEEENLTSEGNRHVLTSAEWIVTLRADGKLVKDLAPNLGADPAS